MLVAQISKFALKQLNSSSPQFAFASLFSKRKPTRKDLDKYDVIWVGSNIGGICSRHFEKSSHGKYKCMAVFDNTINQVYPMRPVYEQQRASKTDYMPNAKLAIDMYTAHSDNIGIDKILPDQNTVILRNGRKIQYDHLVLAMGMCEDLEAIKGFEDAWKDESHPVFTAKDHATWRANNHKYFRFHYSHTSGDAFFCIPPYPFSGEIETYSFFISTEIWKWYKSHGKLSPISSFTIVNANEKFVQYLDSADQFIKEELTKRGVRIEYGLNLVEIDQKNFQATFKDVKTGKTHKRTYSNLYSLIPRKAHPCLKEAGLTASNGLLDVDIQTLRSKRYKNIFGLGDVANLPTTKTFWAGFYQAAVVRNNVQRSLQGQTLNALYDGFTKVPLITGQASLTYISHYYDQVPSWQNLWHKNGGPIARIRYWYWAKNQKKKFLSYYLAKTYGPPYHKVMKKFGELPGSPEAEQSGGLFGKYFALKKTTEKGAH